MKHHFPVAKYHSINGFISNKRKTHCQFTWMPHPWLLIRNKYRYLPHKKDPVSLDKNKGINGFWKQISLDQSGNKKCFFDIHISTEMVTTQQIHLAQRPLGVCSYLCTKKSPTLANVAKWQIAAKPAKFIAQWKKIVVRIFCVAINYSMGGW